MRGEGDASADPPADGFWLRFLRNWSVLVLYLVVLAVAYLRFGFLFQFTLGAAWLAVIPVVAYFGRSREFLKNTVFLISVLLSYEALQGITGSLVSSGSVTSLASVDRAIFGFDFTSAVQNAFASPSATMVSLFFYTIHLFLPIAGILLFWFVNRKVYRGYAYSLVLTSYLALFTFIVFPTSPPWFTGAAQNLIPTGSGMLSPALQGLQNALMSIESDKFAAFPSLHAAYAVLFTVFAFRLNRKFGLVSLIIPGGVFFATIYLGQHYVIDLVGGLVYALGSVALVDWLTSRHTPAPVVGNPGMTASRANTRADEAREPTIR